MPAAYALELKHGSTSGANDFPQLAEAMGIEAVATLFGKMHAVLPLHVRQRGALRIGDDGRDVFKGRLMAQEGTR